jgi:hypothetical protein
MFEEAMCYLLQREIIRLIYKRYREGKKPFGRPRRTWKIILRWIFTELDVGVWTGSSWLRIGTGTGHL